MVKTVIAYEDEPALRKQLENVFYALREEFSLVGSFSEPNQVLDHLLIYKPDIVIMDIAMNDDDDGLTALNKIKNTNPDVRVMMLTTFDVDDKIFNAICLGADGYMLKTDFSSDQLPHEAMRKSIRIILEGGAYLTPSVAKRILNLFSDQSIAEKINKVKERFQAIFKRDSILNQVTPGLTRMQTVVLQKIIDGKSTAEIARELDLKENTINSHIKGIFNILEVHSRAKAIRKALEEKWV
jgi:DNA-binding NarL/FixJ family response regulator